MYTVGGARLPIPKRSKMHGKSVSIPPAYALAKCCDPDRAASDGQGKSGLSKGLGRGRRLGRCGLGRRLGTTEHREETSLLGLCGLGGGSRLGRRRRAKSTCLIQHHRHKKRVAMGQLCYIIHSMGAI